MPSILLALLVPAACLAQTVPTEHSAQERVERLLEALGDPAFEVRQGAVRELYAAGPAVLEALAAVTAENDFEAAQRARNLIHRIQKLYFVGAKIELSASHKQFRWDEPVSLRVKISNPSDFPIHLPFLIRNRQSIDTDALAAQMGNLLDAADFLRIVGPDAKHLDLHVDDIRGEPRLEQALDARVYDEPASLLPPHGDFVLELPAFNRGMARYRMLRQGTYRVRFTYVPEWDDERMRADGIGMVRSNELVLNVSTSAPPAILDARREIRVSIEQVGQEIRILLTCTHDRPIGVNLNIGERGLADHAHLEWHWQTPAGLVRASQPVSDAPPLDTNKIAKLKPGQTIELYRTNLARLGALPEFDKLASQAGNFRLAVRYSNILDRSVLIGRMRKDPPTAKKWRGLYDALPLPTFVGSRTSEFIEVSREAR